jgi:hypothetical protein
MATSFMDEAWNFARLQSQAIDFPAKTLGAIEYPTLD